MKIWKNRNLENGNSQNQKFKIMKIGILKILKNGNFEKQKKIGKIEIWKI